MVNIWPAEASIVYEWTSPARGIFPLITTGNVLSGRAASASLKTRSEVLMALAEMEIAAPGSGPGTSLH